MTIYSTIISIIFHDLMKLHLQAIIKTETYTSKIEQSMRKLYL